MEDEYQLCTINEIMNGFGEMPGICNLIDSYLDLQKISDDAKRKLKSQVNFVRGRANGQNITGATRIRNFVRNHPAYKFDSVVNQEINFDLFNAIRDNNLK